VTGPEHYEKAEKIIAGVRYPGDPSRIRMPDPHEIATAQVHATLATVPLDAGERVIASVAQAQGRILPKAGKDPYADEEVSAAVEVVTSVLGSPFFDRVRNADRVGKCERELPSVGGPVSA
jgi:hypothetical protein